MIKPTFFCALLLWCIRSTRTNSGPEGHPSDAWGLVDNRPALLRRRRPQNGRVAPWAGTSCSRPFSCGHGVPKPSEPRVQALGTPTGAVTDDMNHWDRTLVLPALFHRARGHAPDQILGEQYVNHDDRNDRDH